MDQDNAAGADALPAGFTVRAVRREDAPVAHALVVAHHDASGGNEPPPMAEVVADLEYPQIDLDNDTWLVTDEAGAPALYGIVYLDRPARAFFDLFIRPDLPRPVAVALATAVARRAVDRIVAVARANGLTETIAESGMLRDDTLLPDVLAAVGLVEARTWWRMSADAAVIGAAQPFVVDGIRIERIDPDDDDAMRVAYELEEETFAEHYGNTPATFDMFRTEYRNGAGYDPSAWWIAYDATNDEPAALLIGNDSRLEGGAGFVDTLGVRKSYRGRGLAQTLLLTSFAEYAHRGRTSVALSVDAKNETGAVALYERVGMRPLDVLVSWERTIAL